MKKKTLIYKLKNCCIMKKFESFEPQHQENLNISDIRGSFYSI